MGALKEYRNITGIDPKDMDPGSAVDMATFIYCCIKSACRKDGVEFKETLDDFLDSVDADTVNGWAEALSSASSKAVGKVEAKAKK